MLQKLFIIGLTTLLLAACIHEVEPPKVVAQQYWDAIKTGDHETAKKLATKSSQQSLTDYLALPDEQKIPVENVQLDNEKTTIITSLNPEGETAKKYPAFETVLILEQGKWKVDATRTQVPTPIVTSEERQEELARQLSESMEKNLENMDDALSEGLDMLNEAVKEGSNEMSESLLKGLNKLNESLQETVEQMKKRREQKQGVDEDTGEGVL